MNDILPSCKHDLDIISREISYLDTDNVIFPVKNTVSESVSEQTPYNGTNRLQVVLSIRMREYKWMNLVSNKQSKPAKGGLKKRAFFKNYHD